MLDNIIAGVLGDFFFVMYDWETGDIATIRDSAKGWFSVEYTYDADLKDVLKRVAGRGNYRYNPYNRCWLFRERCFDDIIEMLDEWGYDIVDERHESGPRQRRGHTSQPPPRNQQTPTVENPWAVIFQALSPPQQSALYRAALKTVHPDVGGSNDITRLLIQAWEHIKA